MLGRLSSLHKECKEIYEDGHKTFGGTFLFFMLFFTACFVLPYLINSLVCFMKFEYLKYNFFSFPIYSINSIIGHSVELFIVVIFCLILYFKKIKFTIFLIASLMMTLIFMYIGNTGDIANLLIIFSLCFIGYALIMVARNLLSVGLMLVEQIRDHTSLNRKLATEQIFQQLEDEKYIVLRGKINNNSDCFYVNSLQEDGKSVIEIKYGFAKDKLPSSENKLLYTEQDVLFKMLDLLEWIAIRCLDGMLDHEMFIKQYAPFINMMHLRIQTKHIQLNQSFIDAIRSVNGYTHYLKYFVDFYDKYKEEIEKLA